MSTPPAERARRWIAFVVPGLAVAGALAAAPASASSNISVTLVSGTLSISEPASVNIGTATSSPTGTSVTGKLGTTTINDSRASLAGWSVQISMSSLSDNATPTPHTINANRAKVYIGTGDGPTVTSGLAVPVTSYGSSQAGLTLSTTAQTFVTATTTGSNIVTYNPTVTVTLDSSVVAGTYTGTITQTVS